MIDVIRLGAKLEHLRRRKNEANPTPYHLGFIPFVAGILWADTFGRNVSNPLNLNDFFESSQGAARLLHSGLYALLWIIFALLAVSLWLHSRLASPRKPWQRLSLGLNWTMICLIFGFILGTPTRVQTLPEHQPVQITAEIEAIKPGASQATIHLTAYEYDGRSYQLDHRARIDISDANPEEMQIGAVIRAHGAFKRYRHPDAPGMFNAKQWAQSERIDGLFQRTKNRGVYTEKIRVSQKAPNGLATWLNLKRRKAYETMAKNSSEGIAPALVLGTTKAVEDKTRDDFGKLGIAHILAVSGLHFGIIAAILHFIASKLVSLSPFIMRRIGRKRASILLMLPPLILYLLFVGAPLSAQRALWMIAVCHVGTLTGRRGDRLRALLAAGFAMILCEPKVIFAISFQLSFCAVLGIIWCIEFYDATLAPYFDAADMPPFFKKQLQTLVTATLITLATATTTAPFVLYHFGQLPILGTLTNLIVIPWISFVLMPFAILTAITTMLAFPYHEKLAEYCSVLETATVQFADFAVDFIPLAYIQSAQHIAIGLIAAILACLIWAKLGKAPWRRIVAASAAILFAAGIAGLELAPRAFTQPDGIRLSFVALGQADATLIEFPDGKTMLVDAGSEIRKSANSTQTHLLPLLKNRGIRRIDTFVITHWDYDHIAGLPHLLETVQIGEIWYNGTIPKNFEGIKNIQKRNIPLVNVYDLQKIRQFGNAHLQILWPLPHTQNANETDDVDQNRQSIVLYIRYHHFSALLMGDATSDVERQILQNYPLETANTTLLKAGHHGSKTSSSPEWIRHVAPQYAVFSVGLKNLYQFPHFEVERQFFHAHTKTLRTDWNGTIQIDSNGSQIRIKTMRP